MGIRKRLVILSVGIAVPLTIVGLAMLWGLWQRSRSELEHSIQAQADLAAIAFEKWLDGQRQPLLTLATIASARPSDLPTEERLSYVVKTRPHWIDLQVLNASGAPVVSEPANSPPLPADVFSMLRHDISRHNTWTVATDWTRGEGHPILTLAVPVQGGGTIVARIDGIAMGELFRSIEMSDGAIIAVFDSQRRVLYRSSTENAYFGTNRSNSPLFASLDDQPKAVVEVTSHYDGIRRVYALRVVRSCDCVVAVGVPSATLYSPARRQIRDYLIISFVALLCAVLAAALIARGIARPISRLRDATKEFGGGSLKSRAEIKGGGELEELGATFDEMAENIETRALRLAELDRLKSEFVGSVSHELRTPLTTIKTLTRVLMRGSETNDERREYLETIAAECDRQIDLVLNLLDLSRIEAGQASVTCTNVNLIEVIRSCVAIERHAAQARSHNIVVDLPEAGLFALADASSLRRALCGLIENAIKYTPDGGRIILSARLDNGEAAISVSDNGCGIDAADLPHIFEKFYRGHPSSSFADSSGDDGPQAPGVGLGLYLARSLVHQFDGRIDVELAAGNGTTFTVYLPAVKKDSETKEEQANVETVAHS